MLPSGETTQELDDYCGEKQFPNEQNLKLWQASLEGDATALKEALDQNANANFCSTESVALHQSVLSSNADCAKLLINYGASPNLKTVQTKDTPLHLAASGSHEAVCKLLLLSGAKLDAKNAYGNTALHSAVAAGHPNIVHLLIEHSTSLSSTLHAANNMGNTALHICASFKDDSEGNPQNKMSSRKCINPHVEMAQMILHNGGKTDLVNNNGYTALHCASQSGSMEVVKLLVNFRANVLARTNSINGVSGRTASQIAECVGNEEISTFLRHEEVNTVQQLDFDER